MMLRLLPLALLVAGCATPPATGVSCSVKIEFGSYCCGVDGETRAAVERYLQGARGVMSSTSQAWGREGESTRCVVTREPADTDRIFRDLAAMVPPTANRGPVTVSTADGRTTPTQREK